MCENASEKFEDLKNPYFDLQSKVGISKHVGGLKGTLDLVKLCRIKKESHILEIGCGVGKTTCYLAENIGCKIIAVDLSPEMIQRAKERAQKKNLLDKIRFKESNAMQLPFPDNTFDAVISESVTAFPEDKQKAINEYYRVLKSGGFVGLNETTWIKTPTEDIRKFAYDSAGGVKPESRERWIELMENSGLKMTSIKVMKMKMLEQMKGEIELAGGESLIAGWKMIKLYFTSPVYRKVIHNMIGTAKKMPGKLLDYYGYGIYIGMK
ncbi:MAG: methyltransferase domain-containing protein [Candidatus Diapherotrites archaeon]